MTITELIEAAANGYPDKHLLMCWDKYKQSTKAAGDGLALFIVQELHALYIPRANTLTQLNEAIHGLANTRDEIDSVINELDILVRKEKENAKTPEDRAEEIRKANKAARDKAYAGIKLDVEGTAPTVNKGSTSKLRAPHRRGPKAPR